MAEKSAKEPLQWLRFSWLVLSRLAGQASRYLAGLLQLLTGEIIDVMNFMNHYWFNWFVHPCSTNTFVMCLLSLFQFWHLWHLWFWRSFSWRHCLQTSGHHRLPCPLSKAKLLPRTLSGHIFMSCFFLCVTSETSCLLPFPKTFHSISLEVAVETKLRRQEWRAASASILRSMTIMWNCAKVGNLGLRAQNTKTEGQWQVLTWPFCWGLSSSFSRLVMGRSQKTSAIFWTRCHGMTRICADWWAIGFLLYPPPPASVLLIRESSGSCVCYRLWHCMSLTFGNFSCTFTGVKTDNFPVARQVSGLSFVVAILCGLGPNKWLPQNSLGGDIS